MRSKPLPVENTRIAEAERILRRIKLDGCHPTQELLESLRAALANAEIFSPQDAARLSTDQLESLAVRLCILNRKISYLEVWRNRASAYPASIQIICRAGRNCATVCSSDRSGHPQKKMRETRYRLPDGLAQFRALLSARFFGGPAGKGGRPELERAICMCGI